MDSAPPSTTGGSGGPAPFLLKTYEMVDDRATDEIVSWSESETSFIVWRPPEFQSLLLPTYFKHNNFSSFIRQLNTYGFRKIDPERWEFANEDFVKDKKHLLKNIHRRKPIHSHSNPPVDPERSRYEEEIEKLTREKNDLDTKVSGFRLKHSSAKSQLEDVTQRIGNMEQRQETLLTFLQKAVQNPAFVEHLGHKIDAMDLSAYNKKRRLPRADHFQPTLEKNVGDNQNSCGLETSSLYQQELANKLKLELSTAVSNMNLVSNSTNSSNEDWASPPRKSTETEMGMSSLPFPMETTEFSDTQTCLAFKMDCLVSDKIGAKECQGLQSTQTSLMPSEEYGGQICCQLNLSLASSPLQTNQNPSRSRATEKDLEVGGSQGTSHDNSYGNTSEVGMAPKNNPTDGNSGTLSSSQEGRSLATPARVNDVFWEQFLTERPGSSDTEEASSSYRALPHDEQEDRSIHGMSSAAKNLGKLTL